jgi:thiol-disulfide isomerase/thioredoxin
MTTARSRLAVVGAVALVLVAGCATGGPTPAGGDGQGFVSGDGSLTVVDPSAREPAPELAGTTLDGEQLDLSELRGDVVVLNVWGSWCADCREEAPYLQAVYDDTQRDGVRFVGINTRDDVAAAQAFERSFSITYPSLVDTDGQKILQFGGTLPFSAIPSTVVIDRQGRVAARVLGATTYSGLKRLVDEVAAEPA